MWGENHVGQLGDGTVSEPRLGAPWPRLVDQNVAGEWIGFSAGDVGVCAISAEHRAWCWGRATRGRLPHVPESQIATRPVAIDGLPAVSSVASGDALACAVTNLAETYCWGGRSLETDAAVIAPERIALPAATRSVHAGGSAACAVLVDGTAHCWGAFRAAVAHPEDHPPRPIYLGDTWAQPVLIARDVTALDVGVGFACYRASSKLFCFGSNAYGQLGIEPSGWTEPPGVEIDIH